MLEREEDICRALLFGVSACACVGLHSAFERIAASYFWSGR